MRETVDEFPQDALLMLNWLVAELAESFDRRRESPKVSATSATNRLETLGRFYP